MGQTQPRDRQPESEGAAFLPCPVAKDEEGFITSFDFDDVEGYSAFWERYGFVVVRNVLNEKEIEDSVDEIWSDIELSSTELHHRMKALDEETTENYIVQRSDPRT